MSHTINSQQMFLTAAGNLLSDAGVPWATDACCKTVVRAFSVFGLKDANESGQEVLQCREWWVEGVQSC
jgi:hypothetical protein